MKILIVDDSIMDRKILVNILNKSDVTNEILQACDGEEGLKVLSANHQDICVILLDWQMPKMDGIEFMKGVISVPKVASIPIVMITASGSQNSKDTAHKANPNLAGYIVKPYTSKLLFDTISPFIK